MRQGKRKSYRVNVNSALFWANRSKGPYKNSVTGSEKPASTDGRILRFNLFKDFSRSVVS